MTPSRPSFLDNLLIPRYNELSLFLMSMSFILVFFVYPDLRGKMGLVFDTFDFRMILCLVLFVGGLLLSLYHIFTPRPKSDMEKTFLLYFAIMVNGFTGIGAGTYAIRDARGLLMVFPLCNILSSLLMIYMYRFGMINEKSIVDDNATTRQVLVGSAVVIVTLAVCRFVYDVYWAITFSICVSYATNVNDVLQQYVFPPRRRFGRDHTRGSRSLLDQ